MVFGRGGELVDAEKNPLWTDPNSPAAQQFKWLVDAKNTHKILAIQPHETNVAEAMNTGQHAFTVLFNYNLAALNNAATSALAGQFKLAMMPGETHECYGFAKFYNMTQMAVDRGQETIDASRQVHPVLRRRGRRRVSGRQALGGGAGSRLRPDPAAGRHRRSGGVLEVGRCAHLAAATREGAGPNPGSLVRHLERAVPVRCSVARSTPRSAPTKPSRMPPRRGTTSSPASRDRSSQVTSIRERP